MLGVLSTPTAIIEVLIASIEACDRGDEFQAYRTIPTLRHYVLIAQARPQIEIFACHDSGWPLKRSASLDSVTERPTIGCTLSLCDVYEQVSPPDRVH
ncbi:MAG: Uma2 family endonuclease [Anaerolinea sp.]|nr:Uma2 family endonuclease [Anaerolinea sp.]